MAISAPHYHCLKELHRRGELPQGGALLEIGEANWYGDIPSPAEIVLDTQIPEELLSFYVVKQLYKKLFDVRQVVSIDLQGTQAALKLDLNKPIDLKQKFSTVINHGTIEHIFNRGQAFRTMHDHCEVGGLLIHESPYTGWMEHGFGSIHATTYYDLAAANGYDIRYMAVTQITHGSAVEIHSREQLLKMAANGGVPDNAMLFVAMRKTTDEPFKIPMQGYYAKTISREAEKAWSELR